MQAVQKMSLPSAIRVVRWITIILVFLLALAEPLRGRAGLATWALVLIFAGYNLLLDVLRARVTWLRSYAWTAILDLVIAGGLYVLGAEHGGPPYVLIFLAVVCAAATLPLRASILYVVAASALVIVGEPTLYERPSAAEAFRDLGARTIMLALVAVGTTLLVRRLQDEQEATLAGRLEAERLAELDRVRSNFVAAVSHEFQTPLTAVRAALSLLQASAADRLGSKEENLLVNAQRNVDRLALHINDLLTFNQLDAHALQLNPVRFDLRGAIVNAIAVVHPLIQQKGQTLEVVVPEPLSVWGDPRRLEQVITNLLANAHRHTPAGTRIVIAGQVTPHGVTLTVSDNGPGIPADARDRIFDRFHRLDPGASGSGLGLSIVKAIVDLHGGRVWLDSEHTKGATFHVELPHPEGEA